jgi:hypothetical protein
VCLCVQSGGGGGTVAKVGNRLGGGGRGGVPGNGTHFTENPITVFIIPTLMYL